MMTELTPLEFMAHVMLSIKHPNELQWRWLAMNEKARKKALEEAEQAFGRWKASELWAQKERERGPRK
jgi:hypothetical protein